MQRLALMVALLGAPLGTGFAQNEGTTEDVALPPLSAEAHAALFGAIDAMIEAGNTDGAEDALAGVLANPSQASAHGEAAGRLAEAFEQRGWTLAATDLWARAVREAPDWVSPKLQAVLDLSDDTGAERALAAALAENVGLTSDPELRNRIAIVAARHHLRLENYGTADAILRLGRSDAARFEEIALLKGVMASQQSRFADAIEPLAQAQALARERERDDVFVQLATINLARAHFGAQNFGQATQVYLQVDRGSDFWLDAQLESAWAHFRAGNMNTTLSVLFNTKTSFFDAFFAPESDFLRTYALFNLCKFTAAREEIDAFGERYRPRVDELASIRLTPQDAYDEVLAMRAGENVSMPLYMLRKYRHDRGFDVAVELVERADAELHDLGDGARPATALAKRLTEQLRTDRIAHEGQRVLNDASTSADTLRRFLQNVEITKVDLLTLEGDMYTRAAATNDLGLPDTTVQLRNERKRRRGYRVWPFDGEEWADELGWFVFHTRPDCPVALSEDAG